MDDSPAVRVPPQFDTFYADNYRQVVALVYTLSGSTWGAEALPRKHSSPPTAIGNGWESSTTSTDGSAPWR